MRSPHTVWFESFQARRGRDAGLRRALRVDSVLRPVTLSEREIERYSRQLVLPEWTGQTAGDHPCAGCADHHQDEGERGEAFEKTAGGCEHVGARFLDDDDPRRPRYARRRAGV